MKRVNSVPVVQARLSLVESRLLSNISWPEQFLSFLSVWLSANCLSSLRLSFLMNEEITLIRLLRSSDLTYDVNLYINVIKPQNIYNLETSKHQR